MDSLRSRLLDRRPRRLPKPVELLFCNCARAGMYLSLQVLVHGIGARWLEAIGAILALGAARVLHCFLPVREGETHRLEP